MTAPAHSHRRPAEDAPLSVKIPNSLNWVLDRCSAQPAAALGIASYVLAALSLPFLPWTWFATLGGIGAGIWVGWLLCQRALALSRAETADSQVECGRLAEQNRVLMRGQVAQDGIATTVLPYVPGRLTAVEDGQEDDRW